MEITKSWSRSLSITAVGALILGTMSPAALADDQLSLDQISTDQISRVQGLDELSTTISQIRENNSPGDSVTATGIVTATYPEGGLNGYYIQSETSSVSAGETRQYSDALFIYSPSTMGNVEIGDEVVVTGVLGSYRNIAQLSVTSTGDLSVLAQNQTVIPVDEFALPTDEATREAYEGMLVRPDDNYQVADLYNLTASKSGDQGLIGLAYGDPLVQETALGAPDSAEYSAAVEDNNQRSIHLDDGKWGKIDTTSDVPYLTGDTELRVGAKISFNEPVIFTHGIQWTFEPTSPVSGATDLFTVTTNGTSSVSTPEVDGDLSIATFNVLNYFTSLGEDELGCQAYYDRDNQPTTAKNCTVRGAFSQAAFERQEQKIVAALNELDADIVGLEEIENSAKTGNSDPEFSLKTLTNALNEAAGYEKWNYVANPSEMPELADQDVIRTAFIYQPAHAKAESESVILAETDNDAFHNARDPLAQEFSSVDNPDYSLLAVVNHFKSKSGSNCPAQGCYEEDRVSQANALVDFADQLGEDKGVDDTFLLGDFNSYAEEAPVNAITEAGYSSANLTGNYSYQYNGRVGSMDYIFTKSSERVTAGQAWEINANSSILQEYSRYNSYASNHYDNTWFRSSDHNPIVVGIDIDAANNDNTTTIDILGINDFHGRLEQSGTSAGAAVLSCAVDTYRDSSDNDGVAFVSAGDNIGGSTFTSSVAKDQPTIDVLNKIGLNVSALGNHEFDQGRSDVDDRVVDAADFPWVAANIYDKETGEHAYEPYYLQTFGDLTIGFIGAITEDMGSLVSPAGVADLEWRSMKDEVNAVAAQLTDGDPSNGEADALVVLVHDGATANDESTIAAGTPFGDLLQEANPKIAAIISGHTHQGYVYEVNGIQVIQGKQYGEALSHVRLDFDNETGDVTTSAEVVNLATKHSDGSYSYYCEGNPEIQAIVDDAVSEADILGSAPVGKISADLLRAKNSDGTSENRGGASTIGNWIADMYKWAAEDNGYTVDLAFMNPGGIRADLLYAGEEGNATNTDGVITYKEAAEVQPFANTITYKKYTGAQIRQILEEQWQPGSSRPFLKLGVSESLFYTYDPTAEEGHRIQSITVNGAPIDDNQLYGVVSNSFLMAGGDSFVTFAEGGALQDTGVVDLAATVKYFESQSEVVSPDYAKRAIGLTWDQQQSYDPGDTVAIETSSWFFSNNEPKADSLKVSVSGVEVATATFDDTVVDKYDETGRATVTFTIPVSSKKTRDANDMLVLTDGTTTVSLPISVNWSDASSTPTPSDSAGTNSSADPTSTSGSGTTSATPNQKLAKTGAGIMLSLLVILTFGAVGGLALTSRKTVRD